MSTTRKLWCLMLWLVTELSRADTLYVAVASNFEPTLRLLATDFKQQSGHEMIISAGSTGQLYAQIKQGAPHDVYMAADTKRPQLLIDAGLATNFQIYALGQLVFFSNVTTENQCPTTASDKGIKHLAIANPDLAPYGLAAKQYLEKKLLWSKHDFKVVMGESISQAMHMVATKNATAGLVAQSLMTHYVLSDGQCFTAIDPSDHAPINQAMVLLKRSEKNALFDAFSVYLKSASAVQILQNYGYLTGVDGV